MLPERVNARRNEPTDPRGADPQNSNRSSEPMNRENKI